MTTELFNISYTPIPYVASEYDGWLEILCPIVIDNYWDAIYTGCSKFMDCDRLIFKFYMDVDLSKRGLEPSSEDNGTFAYEIWEDDILRYVNPEIVHKVIKYKKHRIMQYAKRYKPSEEEFHLEQIAEIRKRAKRLYKRFDKLISTTNEAIKNIEYTSARENYKAEIAEAGNEIKYINEKFANII